MSVWTETRLSVRRAVSAGRPLARIDAELISQAPLDADQRDALWLYAWALHELGGRARIHVDGEDLPEASVRRRSERPAR